MSAGASTGHRSPVTGHFFVHSFLPHVRPLRHLRSRLPQEPPEGAGVPASGTWSCAPTTTTPRPTQQLPAYRVTDEARGRELDARCAGGSIPFWAKNAAIGDEDDQCPGRHRAAEKPRRSARPSAGRHCLVADVRLLRVAEDRRRQTLPYLHRLLNLLNTDVFAVAGLHESWLGPRRRRADRELSPSSPPRRTS